MFPPQSYTKYILYKAVLDKIDSLYGKHTTVSTLTFVTIKAFFEDLGLNCTPTELYVKNDTISAEFRNDAIASVLTLNFCGDKIGYEHKTGHSHMTGEEYFTGNVSAYLLDLIDSVVFPYAENEPTPQGEENV